MKLSPLTSVLPATAIAVGVSAIASQPSQAADYTYDYDARYDRAVSYDTTPRYHDWNYSGNRVRVPALDRAYRRDAPAYHYAYYSIARPEYLL